MRASRLLSIQMLLETRGRMSAAALASALEVSVRTLHRDIDELSAAGVPVFAERGRSGGFQLMPGWKTTLTGLTASEAEAVMLTGLAGPASELGLGGGVESAQLKLLTALPAPLRGRAQKIGSRLHLDPVEWYRESDPVPHLTTVASAVWEERQLSISYESWKHTAARTLHPLGLVLKAGIWYLIASHERKVRTWRVSSILEATALDQPSVRPKGFDLARYWRESVRRFESEVFTGEATIACTANGLAEIRRVNAALARAVAQVKPPRLAGERVQLCIPIESMEHASALLLRLSPDVEALAPAQLRRAVRKRIAAATRLYAVTAGRNSCP